MSSEDSPHKAPPEPSGNAGAVLMDDIVQATVRAMISYEEIRASRGQVNLEGQENPRQQANEERKRYSNAEIATGI